VKSLHFQIVVHLEAAAALSNTNLTQDQIRSLRNEAVDTYFNSVQTLAGQVPQEKRDLFVRACLEMGKLPRPEFLPAIMNMIGPARGTFEALLGAHSGHEARRLMCALQVFMLEATMHNKDFAGKGFNMDDFAPPLVLAMNLGLRELIGQETSDAFAQALTRQTGPFRDMLYDLAHDTMEKQQDALHACLWLQSATEEIFSPETAGRLDMGAIRERDLSIARQREILGDEFVTRGAGVALPGLKELNKTLPGDMTGIRGYIFSNAQEMLLNGPSRGRDSSGLSNLFIMDYMRSGVYVNGKHHNLENTGAQGFINLFPEQYAAEKLSNLAHQALSALIMGGMTIPDLQKQAENPVFEANCIGNTDLMLLGTKINDLRIDSLDQDMGVYRLSAFICTPSSNPASSVERVMYEVSVDVNLGAPGANPRPATTVQNVQADFLVRGREVAPDEQ
jgi:hypothetical protein